MKSVLVTGANGYIGKETIKGLCAKRDHYENIVALDIREPDDSIKNLNISYEIGDIRDGDFIKKLLKKYSIDVVVHLASIVTPGKKSNRQLEYEVDVNGTKNVLDACLLNQNSKIIVTTSGAAYGYYSDNPEWLIETDEIRGNEEFAYSHHKKLIEFMLADYREKHPELKQLIFRPGTILGKNTKNQITDLFQKKMVMGIKGSLSPFVFIWDQDLVNCIVEGIETDKTGIFNMAGDGKVDLPEIAKILGKPFIPLPVSIITFALKYLKKFGISQYGPEQVNFLRYRPVLLNKNLKDNFGYTPLKTSREAFLYYLENQNWFARESN